MKTNTGNEPHLGDCKSWAPLLLQNVEANTTIAVDVRVENLCPKSNLHIYLVLVIYFCPRKTVKKNKSNRHIIEHNIL